MSAELATASVEALTPPVVGATFVICQDWHQGSMAGHVSIAPGGTLPLVPALLAVTLTGGKLVEPEAAQMAWAWPVSAKTTGVLPEVSKRLPG